MSRTLRYLRYAFSIGCCLVAVALCVLWVRSYWWRDDLSFAFSSSRCLFVSSYRGKTILDPCNRGRNEEIVGWNVPIVPDLPDGDKNFDANVRSFSWLPMGRMPPAFVLPTWAPILLVYTFSILPWLSWRFSLRTLLIATTLVAVVLGLIVWLASP
jgi:hypothetical protein